VPEGAPAWAPDGTLTVGGIVDGVPRLFSVAVDGGRAVRLVGEHSRDPVWSPDGTFVVYSGADVGTTFPLRAVAPDGSPRPLPPIVLTRGARRLVFLPGAPRTLVVLRGEITHKNVLSIDLDTGREEQMTELPSGFDVRDFDISSDGGSLVFEQFQERSEIALIDRR
jgi:Tol biopolymer transport system component